MDTFADLLGDKTRFFSFTSEPLMIRSRECETTALQELAEWYRMLYFD
ncbi:MAG: hypothetical protein QGH42_00600 [Kiritimatiellia bacterium]|jgi:hypothetical protein|nr:hypothetical protein [Kiritimatiellia bacterium]MDP6810275.1 hypothetical protein [Kiritimatiellia bacterium]MDP7022736.1 hypothetical protein [Kiritimatiellia bacterium]